MVRDGRASESPVDHPSGLNTKLDRRHDRRSLSADELKRLLESTATGPIRHKMSGIARTMLYRVAMEPGFRRREFGALTPACLETQIDPPALVLAPDDVKNRKPTVQVIRPELATELKGWIEASQIGPESPLWPKLTAHCQDAESGPRGH